MALRRAAKSAKLALTPHHLFYLLSRFEELGTPVGPMKIRLENLHDSSTSANYVSFLGNTQRSRSRESDVGSIHSVSSVRSVVSGMSALWASFGIGASISAARTERQKAALQADLKYLYSAFTKIPCLRLSPDWRARLIRGYEEFPFDSAVPLYVFKNVQALEVSSIDFRQFFGWDRLADQLRSLTLKRAGVDDPADILIDIVLDDMDKRSSSNMLNMGILPASKWRFLKHLSLPDNSMTSIPASSLAPLANTLHSLDLSSNLFVQIPDSLATLTALRALNLSHCMIDSLHSLTRNPLPAITALNLRGNRLQSLAGVEKLYPLERLDLRDNRITDPLEVARLTGIPDIREIWVEGNPFTKTHRDYRITIFNLFRKTPGYTEDIVIDNVGPSYSERRYLVERAPVPAAVPVVKAPTADLPAVDVSKPAIIYDEPVESLSSSRKERPTPKAVTSEVNTSSTRRRKAPKRRIVDLATPETALTAAAAPAVSPSASAGIRVVTEDVPTPKPISDIHRTTQLPKEQLLPPVVLSDTRKGTSQPGVPRFDATVVPELPPLYTSDNGMNGWKDSQEWDVSGELYRQKIEALRDKVGNGYLSALSEESWDPSRPPSYTVPTFSAGSTIRSSPTTPRTSSTHTQPQPSPILSGRTLG
ncbi:hypothetical protein ACHAPS_002885 [Verticillium nonalfalfae]